MDGVHDMGGMHGFGGVVVEPDEPVFHASWERLAFQLSMSAPGDTTAFRYAIERINPVSYLAGAYYEHWLTATATLLVEAGVVGKDELDAALGGDFELSEPSRVPSLSDPGESSTSHRFSVGELVRVLRSYPLGHTRKPRYVRGRIGTIALLGPIVPLADVTCHCDRERLEPTYSVRFEATELWAEEGDPVYVELWQSYLQPMDEDMSGAAP